MSGVPKIEIAESVETLKSLMKQQKTALNHAKVQSIYLLKIKVAETVRYLAVIMGRSESTIHYWLQLYKTGGIAKLLEKPPQRGRTKKLDIETVAKIQQELSESEGFDSYKEIRLCLKVCQDLEISYPTVHRIVRYELKGKLKVARLKNLFFTSIDDVKYKVANILNFLSEDVIHSLTGWQYILDALSF